jgi:outer membrane protein TolC
MKKYIIGFTLAVMLPCAVFANELTLEQAVSQAINHDVWITSNQLQEEAYRDKAMSQKALPDPRLSLSFTNLPTNTWDLNQENMTQLKIGVTQRFPAGSSLKLKAKKSQLIADTMPFQRLDRQALLTKEVSHLWLDAYFTMQAIKLIERNRRYFKQLIQITQARYKSAFGQARQQDIIRAKLELTRLDDRLIRFKMQYDSHRQLLAQWLPVEIQKSSLAQVLPPKLDSNWPLISIQKYIPQHPRLFVMGQQINIQQADIDLAKQQYKPGWELNAAYSYRDNSPTGIERADLFSIGVSMDLPIFTKHRQYKEVSSESHIKAALTLDYQLLKNKLMANVLKVSSDLKRLEQRHNLYQDEYIIQVRQQTKAALSAYTRDDGDFNDVIQAYVTQLNSKIDLLDIQIQQRKAIASMHYLMAGSRLLSQGEFK